MTPMLLSWHISMVACHGSQEERRKLWMNTWTDLNKLCENVHDCDLRNYPPRSIDNYLGPRIYHDANQCPAIPTQKVWVQFPAVPQSVKQVWHILGGPAHTCKNALVQKRAYYLWEQPCQNALKGKLIEFPLLACMVEVWQLLYIGEAYARLLAKDIWE